MIGPGFNGNDIIGGAVQSALDFELQRKRRVARKNNANGFRPAWDVNSDGVAFPHDIGLLTHEIAEFSVHRLSPSVFGIEGYGQGVSISVTSELANGVFFEAVQRVQKLRLQEQGRVPGEGQFNAGLPAFQLDDECITGPAFDAWAVFDEANVVQLHDLAAPLSRAGSLKHVQASCEGLRKARIFVFITLPTAFHQKRFNVHIVCHFAQLCGVHAQPRGLLQLASAFLPVLRLGHFKNIHKTASLLEIFIFLARAVMAEPRRFFP